MLTRWVSGVVLALIVRIEFDVLAQRQQAAGIEADGTPLSVLAFVEELCAGVGPGMIAVNRKAPFGRNSVAIAPSETAIGPVQIGSVLVGNQDFVHDAVDCGRTIRVLSVGRLHAEVFGSCERIRSVRR